MMRLIGLGKMGLGMARRLHRKGLEVAGYDASAEARERAREAGLAVQDTLEALANLPGKPRLFWLMGPHEVEDRVL